MSRNIALVHAAVFDAVNAIDRSYEPYAADVHASSGASMKAAAAQAAHDTLVGLYPSRAQIFHDKLAADLADIPHGLAKQAPRRPGTAPAFGLHAGNDVRPS